MRKLIFIFLYVGMAATVQGQYALIGDAAYMNNDCIQLTPDVAYSEGIAYYKTRLNLQNFFRLILTFT